MRRLVVLLFLVACGTSSTTTDTAGDGGTTDGGSGGSAPSPCAVTRAFVERCNGELNCGPANYDAWCAKNDTAVNSDAYRRAEAKCLPDVACTAADRNDCEYKSYMTETPTAAQKALVEAYCKTCEPNDVSGCQTRSVTYVPGGKGEVSDIFIAAWELNDALTDKVRAECTGGALDAGADPCDKAFASCAAGPYLDAVPDCPK